jgi:FeS assembly SUF system protein
MNLNHQDTKTQSAERAGTSQPAADLRQQVVDVLRACYDPEIPVDIYDLGLIYGIDVDAGSSVYVRMTLTSPACPVAGSLPPEVESKIKALPGVSDVRVEVVWDPPWNPAMMSEAAKLTLGFF